MKVIVLRTSDGYWSKGKTIMDALKNLKVLTFDAVQLISVYELTNPKDYDKIFVADFGNVDVDFEKKAGKLEDCFFTPVCY